MTRILLALGMLALLAGACLAADIHVATTGDDGAPGTEAEPLQTIQRAAELAQPGDTITVHEGVYRERVNPPRGGTSDDARITYQAAPGDTVEIKGSEVIKGWERQEGDVWRVSLPNEFFGDFNPYDDPIRGDWFDPKGRPHHTGAVYLDGEWLTEAASYDEVLMEGDERPAWMAGGDYLLNVAWVSPDGTGDRVDAAAFDAQEGVDTAACSEGGECIGWIDHGDWTLYEDVDLGDESGQIEVRAASVTDGGRIEIRLDGPDGALLGTCDVAHTGGWQVWESFVADIEPTGGIVDLCLRYVRPGPDDAFLEARNLSPNLWFATVDEDQTTIWAQFPGVDPNVRMVEINVRQSVFYPDEPGRDFITVRGLIMRHAATPWAPPTAEQIGLLGTHWSKGWVIEDNVISHSVCTGVTLGKHGDEFDNTSANTAEGYVETIRRAHAFPIPWTKEHVGGHVVRRNHISHCEQAGLVGSMGPAFSVIEENEIHDIHMRALFGGAEMAGIKLHGAVDGVIRGNHIYRANMGLWLDWMSQGTRVSSNLFHDNRGQDLFMEVNHGPFLIDNNLFLSPTSLLDVSEGGAYVHNLFAGRIVSFPERGRETPYHPAHSTQVAGLALTTGGDNRFYNNIFVGIGQPPTPEERTAVGAVTHSSGYGVWGYDARDFPNYAAGNVYYFDAQPYAGEEDAVVRPEHDPDIEVIREAGEVRVDADWGDALAEADTAMVTTESLGLAEVAGVPYETADGAPIEIDFDYLGDPRDGADPTPGPLADAGTGAGSWRVWPR
jgi:hypothetical protein